MSEPTRGTLLIDGVPPKMRRPDIWARILSELMDISTFGALYVSGEVKSWPFIVCFGLIVIRYLTRFRFSAFWMVTGLLLQAFLAFQLSIRLQMPPIVASAHLAPIALSWIGLTRGGEDLWGWRMGLGFIGLILASALSPDFSVTLFIICFITAGSVALSCRFLSEEFTRRGAVSSLPAGFVRTSFYNSGVLFIVALIIFPLIPRVQGRGMGQGNDPSKTGYTEDVNLSEWSRVSSKGSSEAALRIYGPDGSDPSLLIFGGLLRSRVLDLLSENRWDSTATKIDSKHLVAPGTRTLPPLMVVREMIGPATLPAPYGTQDTNVELYGYRWGAERTALGEWREGRSRNQRFNYYLSVSPEGNILPEDLPTKINLAVPEAFRTRRMNLLVESLFKGLKNNDARLRALQNHFRKENFSAVYAEDTSPEKDAAISKLSPIERFLFIEKNGHCELFASSYAILLRLAGIPTRLIAGFRVSRNSVGDVLTVRQSDAHAWLEAYLPERGGWLPIDPTPRVLHQLALTDWLRDTYDWGSAKWTQYILNYGDQEGSLRQRWEAAKKFAHNLASGKNPLRAGDSDTNLYFFMTLFIGSSALLSFLGIALIRSLKKSKNNFTLDRIRSQLVSEREKMNALETKVKTLAKNERHRDLSRALSSEIAEWLECYYPLRFGKIENLDSTLIRDLKNSRLKIKKHLKKSA